MRENGGRDDSKWPPLALWPYSAEKIFLIRVCRGLRELVGARPLHLLTQTAPPLKSPTGAFIAAQPRPTPNAAFTSGVVTGNIGCTLYRPRSLRQQPSPLSHLRCQLPQRGSSWHSGKVSGLSAKCAVSPEPLPLGEVDANAVSRRRGLARFPAARMFPQETSAANAAFLHDSTRENAMPDSPQAVRHCAIKIILPLFMRRATRSAFKIVPALPPQRHIICAQRKPHVHQHTSLPQALRLTVHPGWGCTPPWKRNGRGCARPSGGW